MLNDNLFETVDQKKNSYIQMKSQQCFIAIRISLLNKMTPVMMKLNLVFNCLYQIVKKYDYNRHANMDRLLINVNWDTETAKQF